MSSQHKDISQASHEAVSHFSVWPLILTLGVALTFWGLAIKLLGIGWGMFILGGLVLVIGLVGWLWETMSGRFVAIEEPPGELEIFKGISKLKLGVWIFLGGDIILFGAILGSYIYLRLTSWVIWPETGTEFNIGLGLLMTFILLASVFTYAYGQVAVGRGNTGGFSLGLLLTFLLGGAFLAIKALEWGAHFADGFTPKSGLVASIYYFTTGMHALHVLSGLVGMIYFLISSLMGKIRKEKYEAVSLFGLYWVFVDLVWLFIFPMIYLW